MMNNMNFSKLQPKNEVVNLKGKKHEDGGIPLSETKEAEDNESMIGSFMFSNRLMTDKKNTFSDEAKRIEKKYKKDSSILANKSKKKELERLAQSQEQVKQEMAPKENTQEMAYGGSTKDKYTVGGDMYQNNLLNTGSNDMRFENLLNKAGKITKAIPLIRKEDKRNFPLEELRKYSESSATVLNSSDLHKNKSKSELDNWSGFAPMKNPETGRNQYGAGGLMAAQAGLGALGGLINMGRGIFGKPRQFDDLSFERSTWDNASFEKANFDNVDYSQQRNQIALDTNKNTQMGNATIRNNASSSGQLLGNTLMNMASNQSRQNAGNRESFMAEENTNVGINNQQEQFNVGTANQFSQFNTQGRNQTNQFNTQIGNQELMTNFDIKRMNANAKDAQQQMIFDGLGQVLQQGSNFMGDFGQYKQDQQYMKAFYPEAYNSLPDNTGKYETRKRRDKRAAVNNNMDYFNNYFLNLPQ